MEGTVKSLLQTMKTQRAKHLLLAFAALLLIWFSFTAMSTAKDTLAAVQWMADSLNISN